MLKRQGRLDEAAIAYESAGALRPNRDVWLHRLGRLNVRRGNWQGAIACYETLATRNSGDLEIRLKLAQCLDQLGAPLHAQAVYREIVAESWNDVRALRGLAISSELVGDWQDAVEADRTALVVAGEDGDLLLHLARCLDLLDRVPFRCVGGVAVPVHAHHDLREEVIAACERAALAKGHTPRTRHQLGRAHERHGNLELALQQYRSALCALESVDTAWRNRVEPMWRFRERYVAARLAGGTTADPHLSRVVAPAVCSVEKEPSGFFEASITHAGLQLDGFVVSRQTTSVDIEIDGVRVKTVDLDHQRWLPAFTFEISHNTLSEFPEQSTVTLLAHGRPLVVEGGGAAVRLDVPGGTGQLAGLVGSGRLLTKKGTLVAPGRDRRVDYLEAYRDLRDRFEELLGRKLFLLYGTLLGCHRDGDFIGGDDDFDVGYLSDAKTPAQLKEQVRRDSIELLRAGYDIAAAGGGRLFKVRSRDTWIDVNPIWFFDGCAWGFNRHRVGRAVFEPVESTEFLGYRVYVPKDTAAFLADNYGDSWRAPQPGFRYYRHPADVKIMRRSWLRPTELAEFSDQVKRELQNCPDAGAFLGIQDKATTGFIND